MTPHDPGPGHEHAQDHEHPPRRDVDSDPPGYFELLGEAVFDLLVAKGVVTAAAVRAQIERMDARGPHLGARVVARAWSDPA